MCTMVVENTAVSGSGKGPSGWFPLAQASVSYDHPFHTALEYTLNIDFMNEREGLSARVAVELTPEAARNLVAAILTALARGEEAIQAA